MNLVQHRRASKCPVVTLSTLWTLQKTLKVSWRDSGLWHGCCRLGDHLEKRLSEPQAAQHARHICCSPGAGDLSPARVFARVWRGQQVYGKSNVVQSADVSAPRMHHLLYPEHMYHKVLILQQKKLNYHFWHSTEIVWTQSPEMC